MSPYSPQSNGLSERSNKTLLDKVRALLENANLKEAFCGKAPFYAAYYISHMITPMLLKKPQYETLLRRRPEN